MKTTALTVFFLIAGFVWAKDHDASEYPLKAHVVASGHSTTPGSNYSHYDPNTGHWSYGHANGSWHFTTEVQIEKLVYVMDARCNNVDVGSDYPAQKDNKTIKLLIGTKECKGRIEETREAK